MKILIAGCGYVGEKAAELAASAGHQVVAVTHSAESRERLSHRTGWHVAQADLANHDDVARLAVEAGEIDAFVHCASSGKGGAADYRAVYVQGMTHLLNEFPSAFPVFTSSSSVYAQTDGSIVDETSPAEPARETGIILLEAERLALERGGAVVRLTGIYGPGRSFVLKNLLEGRAAVEATAEAPEGRILNQIHRDDAAAALVHVATHRLTGIFNASDDAPMTQRACLAKLASLFCVPVPPLKAPDPTRKRGWTHKAVANAKLKATGWQPRYPRYFDALQHDPDLASSTLEQIIATDDAPLPRAENIIMIGLMGSGKSTVGRLVAHMLGFQLVDTDQMIIESARRSIPDIFAAEGEAGFRERESAALRSLIGRQHCVIATGGGIVTQPRNLPLLRHLGFITWLEADPALLARRTASSNDRPLLRGQESPLAKLTRLLHERAPLYQSLADLRIQTDGLSQEESAYGVAESARVHFIRRRTFSAPPCQPTSKSN